MIDQLDSKERMARLFTGKPLDRVPFISSATMFSAVQAGLSPEAFFSDPATLYETQLWIRELYCCDGGPSFCLPGWISLGLGTTLCFPAYQPFSIPQLSYPIQSPEDAERFALPEDLSSLEILQRRKAFCRLALAHGQKVSMTTGSPFEIVGQIVEPSLLFRWLRKEPALVHKLSRQIVDYLLMLVDSDLAEFGVEHCTSIAFYPFESQRLMPLSLFEKFSFPYIAFIHEELQKRGVSSYQEHLCGQHKDDFGYFKSLSLPPRTCISVDEQVDIKQAAAFFGEDYILAGNVSSATLICGTPQEVYQASRHVIEQMKYHPGGFILMPSCDLPPYTPPLNLYAMLKAARDFGRYQ